MVSMVLDGELIGMGSDGKPSFNALQNRAQLKGDAEIEPAAGASPCIFACLESAALRRHEPARCAGSCRRSATIETGARERRHPGRCSISASAFQLRAVP